MTHDEAMAAIKARAPMDMLKKQAGQRPSTMGRDEELAYLLAKWARANGTDEELAAIGMIR